MTIVSQIADIASFSAMDRAWQNALRGSLLVGIGSAVKSSCENIDGAAVRKFGSALQSLSFAVGLVLFAALAHPKFAEDKWGLAIICMSGCALWLLGFLLGGKESRQSNAVDIFVLLFFGVNIIATFASHYLIPAMQGLGKLVVYICSYFYLTALLNNSPKRKLVLVSSLVAVALAASLYGLWQFKTGVAPLATWEDPTVETQGTRIFSTLKNPNLLAGYLIPIAPLAFALGFSAITSRKWLLAFPALIPAAIISVAIILTGSRGGYLATGAAGAAIFLMAVVRLWLAKPKARPLITILCIVVPIILMVGLHFVPSFEQRLTSIFAGREHSSNSFRINVWHASWKMFLDNWWIGIGPGNQVFRLAYGLYMISGFDALGTYCVPLEVAVECGVLGLACFVLLLISLFARAHISFWSGRNTSSGGSTLSLEQWLTAGAAAALVGLLAQGMVDTVFYRPQVQFIFWLVVALIVTDKNSIKRNS